MQVIFPEQFSRSRKSVEQDLLQWRISQFPDLQLLSLHVLRQIIFSCQLLENIDGYRKGLDMVRTHKIGMRQTQETFSHIKCGKVWLQKFKFRYSIAKFLLVWLNQFNRAASTTETKSNSIFAVKFVERSNRSFSVYLTNQRYNYNSIELWNFNCVNISTRSEAIKILLQQILKRHKIVFKNNSLFPVQCTLALNSPIRRQKCVLAISEALKNILSYLYKNTHVYIIDKKETESHFRYYEMI